MKTFIYLACPVRPLPGSSETKESNLARAREYYRRLSDAHPDKVFLAPWILNCEVFPETSEAIAIGMKRNYAVIDLIAAYEPPYMRAAEGWIKNTNRLWLCGPRVTEGMQKEADYAASKRLEVQRIVNPALDEGLGDGWETR